MIKNTKVTLVIKTYLIWILSIIAIGMMNHLSTTTISNFALIGFVVIALANIVWRGFIYEKLSKPTTTFKDFWLKGLQQLSTYVMVYLVIGIGISLGFILINCILWILPIKTLTMTMGILIYGLFLLISMILYSCLGFFIPMTIDRNATQDTKKVIVPSFKLLLTNKRILGKASINTLLAVLMVLATGGILAPFAMVWMADKWTNLYKIAKETNQ